MPWGASSVQAEERDREERDREERDREERDREERKDPLDLKTHLCHSPI